MDGAALMGEIIVTPPMVDIAKAHTLVSVRQLITSRNLQFLVLPMWVSAGKKLMS
jgi:hypothetical protein